MATAAAHAPAIAGVDDPYRDRYLIAIAVTLASVLELVDTSIVNVAIPDMMGNLGATLDEIAWVSTGYIIANVIVIPMSSWLSGLFGRRRYLAGSIALFVIASFFCGASSSLGMLVTWRVIQGLGGGALLSTAQATLFESFPPQEVGIGQAIFGVGVMVGPTIGPTLGGWIVDNFTWPWIFYINVPLGIIAFLMVIAYVRDAAHQEKPERVDYAGIALLAVCIGSLQFMLERGERNDWFDSKMIIALAVTAGVAGILLVWHELRTEHPVIDFHILKSRQLTAGVIFAAFLGLALYGSVFVLPIFLQQLHGFTAWQTGMVILPGALASAVTMGFVGPNVHRIDARLACVAGAVLFFCSMYLMSMLSADASSRDLFWPLILRGVGLGLIFVPLTGATMADLPTSDLAQGTGLFNVTRQLGGSLGIAIMATLLTHFVVTEKAVLATHIVSGDPYVQTRLMMIARGLISRGVDPGAANTISVAMLDREVTAQASVLAFSRIYMLSGMLLICALPVLLLFKTGKGRASRAMDAH